MFSLETLSDNKTGKNGRINGRFSLHTLAFQAKHGSGTPCVIKGNASPAQAAALMLDTDEGGVIFESITVILKTPKTILFYL